MEQFIGHVVNKFNVVWKKYTGDWKDLKHIVRSCLALHNMETHMNLVQTKIFNKSDDEWQSFLVEHEEWLDENVTFPILSQRELERRRRQRDAQSQPDSISVFMIKVKLY